MATGSRRTSSSSSGTGRKTAGATPRKRTTSKPLIIDVDAEASTKEAGKTTAPKADDTKATGGLTADAAKAAGLSADAKAAKPVSTAAPSKTESASAETGSTKAADAPKPQAASAKASNTAKASADSKPAKSLDPQTVVPPGGGKASQSGGGSPFLVFAAGIIGALLALVLFFLANTIGLFTVSDGRVDGQAAALNALEDRVSALETVDADGLNGSVSALQADVSSLRADFDDAIAGLSNASDAAPLSGESVNVEGAVADALGPLVARLDALEAGLSTVGAQTDSDTEGAAQVEAAGVAALAAQVSTLQGDIADLQTLVSQVQSSDGTAAADARLDAVEASLGDALAQISGLSDQLEGLAGSMSGASTQIASLGADVAALSEAPVPSSPDQLARLGLALDAIHTARDSGGDIAVPLAVAQQTASSDADLAALLAGLTDLPVTQGLSDGALASAFSASFDAMQAALPTEESAGLFGALQDRARQMVSIRTSDGTVVSGSDSMIDQLNDVGRLIDAGSFSEAAAALDALPEAVQAASGDLPSRLGSRVTLDQALRSTQQAVVERLASVSSPAGQ